MSASKLCTVIGNSLYAVGVLLMVYSYRVNTKVMGQAALGIAIMAPEERSVEWKEKDRLRKISDWLFYGGMVLTLAGIIAQTIGVLK